MGLCYTPLPFFVMTSIMALFMPFNEIYCIQDLEEVEGDAPEIIELRKAMIDMAADGDGAGSNSEIGVEKISIRSAVILNLGHSASLDFEYFYTSIPETRFS